MTYDEAIAKIQGMLGGDISVEAGSATEDPEHLSWFSGRLARAVDNPLGRGGDLMPPDPTLFFHVVREGSMIGGFILGPHLVESVEADGEDLRFVCGGVSLTISPHQTRPQD